MIASSFPRETLLHVAKTMPAAPQILARLGRMLLNFDSDLEDITALLRCDTALTTRLLRIANSVVYNTGTPYASLEEALARVGFSEVYRITGFAAAGQLADQRLALYGVSAAQLRENSLLSALMMEALATDAGTDPRAAYTAGLLRSTGKVALDRLTRDPAYSGGYPGASGGPLAEWEASFVGLSNCEAAAFVLSEWRFPPAAIVAIRDHYSPSASAQLLTPLLNLAAGAAERGGHGLPGELGYWTVTPEKLDAAGLTQAQLDDATCRALELFGPVRAALA
jgi:HD-like signal output (HDOD) protein